MALEQSGRGAAGLGREQKLGFVFLLVFGVVALVLGVLQIRNTLFAPFALDNSIPPSLKETVVGDVEYLRYRDTDRDGLSDYDETYNYETSPYLYDTFGYGMSDKAIVEKGLPRCANAGKNCVDASTPLGFVTSTPVDLSPEGNGVVDINAVLKDPKQVRELLISSGIKKEVLDTVSDNDLMLLVDQLMASSSISTSSKSTN